MIKVIVFDIDGTLLYRNSRKLPNQQHDATVNGRYIYFRPYLDALAQFIRQCGWQLNKFTPVLWSSMRQLNAEPIAAILAQNFGLKFDKVFGQSHCEPDLSKNLQKIADHYKLPLNQVVLVDDSIKKRINKQNFIEVTTFEGDHTDSQIIRLIQVLKGVLIKEQTSELLIRAKQQMPEKKDQQVGIDKDLKVIVFDLNKTLISKLKYNPQDRASQLKVGNQEIVLRPYLSAIKLFYDTHIAKHNFKLIIWTTMSGNKNAHRFLQILKKHGLPFQNILEKASMNEQMGKDLTKVCQLHRCLLANTILIDDSPYKRVQKQNFIEIRPYRGEQKDEEIIRIVGKLDEFIGCKTNCEVKRLLKSEVEIQKKLQPNKQAEKVYHNIKEKKHRQRSFYKDEQETQMYEIKPQINPNTIEKKTQSIPPYKAKFYPTIDFQPIRCLVFDINETLLNREVQKIQGVHCDKVVKHYYNYLRPNLSVLAQFFKQNPQIKKCLWTTIKLKNSQHMRQLLQSRDLHFDFMFTQENLVNMQKNLSLVKQQLGFQIEQIVLIDDNLQKRVNEQNFMHVKAFKVQDQGDDVLVHLVDQLQKIIR